MGQVVERVCKGLPVTAFVGVVTGWGLVHGYNYATEIIKFGSLMHLSCVMTTERRDLITTWHRGDPVLNKLNDGVFFTN